MDAINDNSTVALTSKEKECQKMSHAYWECIAMTPKHLKGLKCNPHFMEWFRDCWYHTNGQNEE